MQNIEFSICGHINAVGLQSILCEWQLFKSVTCGVHGVVMAGCVDQRVFSLASKQLNVCWRFVP